MKQSENDFQTRRERADTPPSAENKVPAFRIWPVVLCGCIPLLALAGVPWAGVAMSPYGPVDHQLWGNAKQRHAVLSAMPKNPDILVNVRLEHLPSTHEMTLLGKAALPALEKGLTHNTNPTVRRRIALVLAEMADFRSLDALQAAMKDWDLGIRLRAMRALAAVGSPKAQATIEAVLNDPEERDYTKAAAIRALGWIGAASAADRLLGFLADEKGDYGMRLASLSALWDMRGKIPRRLLRRGLIAALDSKLVNAKIFAAAAAAELRDNDRNIQRALLRNIRDPNEEVRNVSVYALGEIGDSSAIQPLRERLPAARSGRLLNNIAFALYKLNDPRVLSSLGDLLNHRQAVIRLNAAFVLGDTGEKKAVPMLLNALADDSDAVKASTIAALGRLGDARAVRALEKIAGSNNMSLRIESLKSLNSITKGGYNDRIAKEFLNSRNHNMRNMAAFELARHGDPRAIDALLGCLSMRMCTPQRVARALNNIKSWRTASAAVTAYTISAGRQGETNLLHTATRMRLDRGQISVLRNYLPIVWNRRNSRLALVRALGRLNDKASKTAFWSIMRSRDHVQVLNAAQALANQGYDRGNEVLLTTLTQGAPSTKRSVVHLMRSVENKESIKQMKKGVDSSLEGHGKITRAAAAFAMTKWNPEKGVDILVELLGSDSRRIREEAGYYLTHSSMREHGNLLRKKMEETRDDTVQGALRRVLLAVSTDGFKPRLWQRLPF